ncbi:uncharacterized protein Z519_09413 [Cladophialophora bantiana CBS 173.52]|uniref:FAD/NAD(P)-binding domain-containing protein n=1 Tax=Cladophialophora bantiana (strain ATCC 10958 / CBS 173.52 / CDC B-1940 / NIH 8579) TaxID=1442370 RepID=A0A0D2H9U1_CLAB1|nr:uncharacterized protein Z519_09413 [Cladophialophora bantiana CBS 173.52]KIW89983.1 hypothetical protein Z519_09413 [Cladophialophora bantiana CBS 173.52]
MAPLLDIEPDSPFDSGFLDLKQATVATSDVQVSNGFLGQDENGHNGLVEHVPPLTNRTESLYIVKEVSMGTRKPIRVVCLGAGYSGIMMGIVYAQRMTEMNVGFCIYEKNADMGCQCDIPAHNYSYSFEPNPNWPNYYATSRQIHDYMKHVMEKYDVDKYIHTSHQILMATWDSEQGRWDLRVRRPSGEEFDDHCEVFINAGGLLKSHGNWKWPNIPGIGEFEGKLMHSASWDESYDLTGKRVAVIGIGSSGIQIVPKIVKDVDKLAVFIRSKTWISPGPGINEPSEDDPKMDPHYNYTPDEISRLNSDPEYLKQHRRNLADRRAKIFDRAIKTSDLQSRAQVVFRATMKERLGDTEKGRRIAEMLIPDFPIGCRRQTPGFGFLESLVRPNVEVIQDRIVRVTKEGIVCKDGEETKLESIICATGFDTTFKPRIPIVGQNGLDLWREWDKEDPEAYFGIEREEKRALANSTIKAFLGPNSPISNGTLVGGLQMTAVYIYRAIFKLQTQSIKSLTVKSEVVRDYNIHCHKWLERSVWTAPCANWYKRGTKDGKVVAIYAGTSYHFMEALREPRWEDYGYEYDVDAGGVGRNRFAYLGNGHTVDEERGENMAKIQTLDFDEYWDIVA